MIFDVRDVYGDGSRVVFLRGDSIYTATDPEGERKLLAERDVVILARG